jgi:PAS domain S-box-containing protein
VYAFSDKSGGMYYSPRVEQVLGYSPEYLYEHPYLWNSSIHHDDLAAVENAIRESTTGKSFEVEYRIRDARGNWRWLLDRSIKRNNLYGETIIEGMARDITDRKHSEEIIKTSEFKFRTVADYAYDWEYWLGEDQRIIFMSPSCERITGYTTEEFIADPALVQKIVHPDDAVTFNHHHDASFSFDQQNDNDECEFKVFHKNGEVVNILHNCRPIYDENGRFLGRRISNKNITERKKTEEKMQKSEKRLQQSEKMEAIRQLAGGIAHDFNNILTGIIGYTGMSQRHAENNPVLKKNLVKILAASDRAKHLVQQILSFSRQSSQQKVVTPLMPIVKEVLDLLKASIPSSVAIESDLENYTKPVLADPTKIHEVILNLATNAVQAMKQKGTLTVRLLSAVLRQTESVRTGELAPGEYSVIEVTDTGCGMNSQTIGKSFEPFFTTKRIGEGTGMGLSVVLGIVQQHGGNIQVESVEGKGTTFRIYLPASLISASDSGKKKSENTAFGSERILFVDDEQMLVDLAENELTYLGYTVTCMSNGRDALEFLKNDASRIDILITDQTMPGLTGIELAQEALKLKHDLPVILCTGFSSQVNSEITKAMGIQHFVLKPYDINEISRLIRKMIDQKNGK